MPAEKHVVLEGNKVVNIIMWDPEEVNDSGFLEGEADIRLATDEVGIGWELANDEWVPPVVIEEPEVPHEDPTVTEAKYSALKELTDLGISETNARIIVGLPPTEEAPA